MEGSLHQNQGTGGALGSETVQPWVCSVCQGLFDKESPRGYVLERAPHERLAVDFEHDDSKRYVYTYIHHADLRSLLVSVEAGCRICTIISKAIERRGLGNRANIDAAIQAQESARPVAGPQAAQPDVDLLAATKLAEVGKRERLLDLGELYNHGKGRILIRHYFDFESQKRSYAQIEARIHYLTDDVHKLFSLASLHHFYSPYDIIDPDLEHRPSKDLLSGPHIALINRWRQVCEREHKSCRKFGQDQPLPHRVLEITDPSDKKTGVRLVENQDETRGAYACLSYCWGQSNTDAGQTKRSNISSYLEGIPLDDLPSTIVDAIRLCHQLGIRYLWVDRLCIKQDDEKDWSKQASRMCEVYSRSALTISVPLCKESSESFLARRRLGFRERDEFTTITHKDNNSTTKSMSWISEGYLEREVGPWFLEKNWEWFTSSSNNTQNRWLGRGWTFQEWILSPRVLHIDSITLWDCFDGYANEIFHRDVENPCLLRNPTELGNRISWDFIIEEYSARRITHEKDRLPALAGLAVQYAKATGHTYLAGLWREGLLRSLLWERSDDSDSEYAWRVNKYAPSWSWASLNESIWYNPVLPGEEFTEKASMLSAFCQYNPPNSYSTVEKAWIEINGRVGIVTATTHVGTTGREMEVTVGWKRWTVDLDYNPRFWDDAIQQRSISLLLIGSNADCTSGLVIQECEDEDKHPCYRRLGIAWHDHVLENEGPSDVGLEWEARVVRLI